MANFQVDNSFIIQESATTALDWPRGARIQSVVFFAVDTTARAVFQIRAGTPILEWGLLDVKGGGNATSAGFIIQQTYNVPIGGVSFPVGWIPTTMTACSAWVHFS